MQSTALGGLLAELRARAADQPSKLCSLYAAFGQVPDPRRRQGQRYPLPFLLSALLLAMLCNCNSLDAVGEWCAAPHDDLQRHFPAP